MTFQYRCFKDICSSTWQYCHEDDKRCGTCTPTQCEKDEAEKIFNQCANKCTEWMSTTTTTTTTTETTSIDSAESPVQVCSSGVHFILQDVIILTILAVIIFLVLWAIFLLYRLLKRKPTGIGYSSHSLFNGGGAESRPLIKLPAYPFLTSEAEPVKWPVQINTDASSGRAANMMYDAEILNEATVGRDGQHSAAAQPHQ